jgi:hypothetical protein
MIWVVWTETSEEQPPPSENMTGLTGEQVAWLYSELREVVEWVPVTGRPRTLSLYAALVAVLFGLRQNLADAVVGELFGCSGDTISRYQGQLEPLIDSLLSPLSEEIKAQARRGPGLVDGFVAGVGERDGVEGLYSKKKGISGLNVQVVSTLDGRLADVGDPCPGSTHDARAFVESGIAGRWWAHYEGDRLGMIGDKGYQGTGIVSPRKKPPNGELRIAHKVCNKAINKIRAAVERAIAHLKCWKVLKTGFRRTLDEFPATLRLVTKLEIFRVYGMY